MTWMVLAVILTVQAKAQTLEPPQNLLIDPRVDAGGVAWQSHGEATIKQVDGNPCFVVRNRGSFQSSGAKPEGT